MTTTIATSRLTAAQPRSRAVMLDEGPLTLPALYAALGPDIQHAIVGGMKRATPPIVGRPDAGPAGKSFEDKLAYMLGALMAKMDRDIEAQVHHVEEVQGQRAPDEAADAATGQEKEKDPKSVDLEMLKLKRMTEKREEIFSMIQGALQKFKETTDKITQAMGT